MGYLENGSLIILRVPFQSLAMWTFANMVMFHWVAGVSQNIDFAVEQMMSLGEEPEPSWPEFLESLLKVR